MATAEEMQFAMKLFGELFNNAQPEYSGWMPECRSWHKTCYLGDWTGVLSKVKISGPNALDFIRSIFVNDVDNFPVGKAKHGICCDVNGNICCEGILMHTDVEEYVYQVGPALYWVHTMAEQGNWTGVELEDFFSTNFQISGPNSLALIEELSGESLRDVKFMHFKKINIQGITMYALRQGMAGEVGFELMAPIMEYYTLHDILMKAGEKHGIVRMGGRAFGMNHIENGFYTANVDYLPVMYDDTPESKAFLALVQQRCPYISNRMKAVGSANEGDPSKFYRNPVELGWGNRINFNHKFLGDEALKKIMAEQGRMPATLEWNKEDVIKVYASMFEDGPVYESMELPRNYADPGIVHADFILKDGKKIGYSTNRGYTINFRKMLSLCVIDPEYAQEGTEVEVLWGDASADAQILIRATVRPCPYKENRNKTTDLNKI